MITLHSTIHLSGQTFHAVDSMRIVGWQYCSTALDAYVCSHNFFKAFKKSKETWDQFDGVLENWGDSAYWLPAAYVDTILTSPTEASSILEKLSNLKKYKKPKKWPYDTKHYRMVANYHDHIRRVSWSPDLFFRAGLLIVVFYDKRVDLIWLDKYAAHIGDKIYIISKDLGIALSKYTHSYDYFEDE